MLPKEEKDGLFSIIHSGYTQPNLGKTGVCGWKYLLKRLSFPHYPQTFPQVGIFLKIQISLQISLHNAFRQKTTIFPLFRRKQYTQCPKNLPENSS